MNARRARAKGIAVFKMRDIVFGVCLSEKSEKYHAMSIIYREGFAMKVFF